MPQAIEFKNDNAIYYTYNAMGEKLKTEYYTIKSEVHIPMGSIMPYTQLKALSYGTTRAYCGSLIYENDVPSTWQVDNGYVSLDDSKYYFYSTDHEGNTRAVVNQDGTVEQINNYCPYGLSYAKDTKTTANRFKYNDKELETMHNLDWYDYGARFYDPELCQWHTVDPLAEKYYDVSPYAYCKGNPVNRIDADGMDWYTDTDKDKTFQYNPDLNQKNQKDILGKGQIYVGETYEVKDEDGNITTNYRRDGSVMFANETNAYNRMWHQANKVNREQFAVIGDKSVLVLPDYKNDNTTSEIEEYGYSFKDLKLVNSVTNFSFSILATIHTHQDGLNGKWGFIAPPGFDDNKYFPRKTPNIPYFTMAYDHNLYGNVGNRDGYHNIELPNGYNRVNNLLSGAKLQLLLRINRRKSKL